MAAVLKTADPEKVPQVRILYLPRDKNKRSYMKLINFVKAGAVVAAIVAAVVTAVVVVKKYKEGEVVVEAEKLKTSPPGKGSAGFIHKVRPLRPCPLKVRSVVFQSTNTSSSLVRVTNE